MKMLFSARATLSPAGELCEALLALGKIRDGARVIVRLDTTRLEVVDVEVGVKRMAVQSFACCGQHDKAFVAAKLVSIKCFSRIPKGLL